ncbi:hypothetical protein RQP46_001034 [Phenoliferia psychrophenolica]
MIPGVTLPLSSLPLLILALFVAQSFHELGHALAAACESIPLLSTGVHLWVALPTFYVSLPSATQSSPTSELRIATAGVWHNLILVAFYWLLSEQGAALGRTAASPAFRAVDVTVSDVVPKLFWIPLWLPRTLEAFYSNTISLSLALAFFNLLPLPRLDGSAILLSFLRCVHAQPQDLAMEEG